MLCLSSREEDEDDDDRLLDACQQDLRALKEACRGFCGDEVSEGEEEPDDLEDDDDDILLISIQKRFGAAERPEQPPLSPSFAEENDDDILRAVQERFSTALAKTTNAARVTKTVENHSKTRKNLCNFEESTTTLHHGSSVATVSASPECNENLSPTGVSEQNRLLQPVEEGENLGEFNAPLLQTAQNTVDVLASQTPDQTGFQLPGQIDIFDDTTEGLIDEHVDRRSHEIDVLKDSSDCCKNQSVRYTLDALKKNRLSQKVLTHKLELLNFKLEENRDLKKRVRVLLDFQSVAKRKYAFQEEYAVCNDGTTKRQHIPAWPRMRAVECAEWRRFRPPENEDVAKFRTIQKKYCLTFEPKAWTKEERRELVKGVEQQIQESSIRSVMDLYSGGNNDATFLDDQVRTLAAHPPTPEQIRQALLTVDWNEVARMYVVGRSPTECWIQWSNHEDCLINQGPWTKSEDKKLWSVVKQHRLCNWDLIAQQLGSRRSIAQCLIRYQRSLNAGIMRGPWTQVEDDQLRAAVQQYGDQDWLSVAAALEGRTGPQCWNRWHKIISPSRQKCGRWSVHEDKRLRLAVSVYGPRTWKLIAAHVPGRTEVQCRERWCNVLSPSLTLAEWTKDEDKKLEAAVAKHGSHRWSAVASELSPRTDNQCWRRWKHLHPELLSAFQVDNKIQRAALISNFVGRKRERSKLQPSDFVPEPGAFDTHMEDVKKDHLSAIELERLCENETANLAPSLEVELALVTPEISKQRRLERLQKRREARVTQKLLTWNHLAEPPRSCIKKFKKPAKRRGERKKVEGGGLNGNIRCNPGKNGTKAFVKAMQELASLCKRTHSGSFNVLLPHSTGDEFQQDQSKATEISSALAMNVIGQVTPENMEGDEEVEIAVKAVLSWPFMWSMQNTWQNAI